MLDQTKRLSESRKYAIAHLYRWEKEMPRILDHVDLRVRDLAIAGPFYRELLPLLGFTVQIDIPGWLQFEAPGTEATEFFGVTEDPRHVANRTRIAFWASSKQRVDELAHTVRKLGVANIEGPGFEGPIHYAVFFDDPSGNALEICFRSRSFQSTEAYKAPAPIRHGSSLTLGNRMTSRLERIVERMQVRPGDRILEVGCGHGVAADLICQRLTTGRLVAIDRSAKMIAAAVKRNAQHISAGLAEFHVATLEDFDPGKQKFDVVLAARIGLFHREPERAHHIVKQWLKPRGRMIVEFDEP